MAVVVVLLSAVIVALLGTPIALYYVTPKEERNRPESRRCVDRRHRWTITEPGDEFGYFPHNKEPGDDESGHLPWNKEPGDEFERE